MKKTMKTLVGVTLLEIMLVLAIAAMIIVMSIRYYQSASSSQQANAVMEQLQSIAAAADSLSQTTGSYSTVTAAGISPLLGTNGLTTPWGGTVTYATATATTYTLTLNNVPSSVCNLLVARVTVNTHFTSGACTAGAKTTSLVFTYAANP